VRDRVEARGSRRRRLCDVAEVARPENGLQGVVRGNSRQAQNDQRQAARSVSVASARARMLFWVPFPQQFRLRVEHEQSARSRQSVGRAFLPWAHSNVAPPSGHTRPEHRPKPGAQSTEHRGLHSGNPADADHLSASVHADYSPQRTDPNGRSRKAGGDQV
jgi:hypothetical protein